MNVSYPFADLELARRLERTEAHANRRFVESRARLEPAIGASWIEVDGAYAMFDGVGSPLTQTFRLGTFEPLTDSGLSTLEAFFAERGAQVFHEVSPLADASVPELLSARGYEPFEFTSVMYRPVLLPDMADDTANSSTHARLARHDEADRWAHISAAGWGEMPELSAFMLALGQVMASTEDGHAFLAEVKGELAATGFALLHEGVVLMAGASTVPSARHHGAQRALLRARLDHAEAYGADLAMMCALPGSASQRNAERHGFRIAYTRMKWRKREA